MQRLAEVTSCVAELTLPCRRTRLQRSAGRQERRVAAFPRQHAMPESPTEAHRICTSAGCGGTRACLPGQRVACVLTHDPRLHGRAVSCSADSSEDARSASVGSVPVSAIQACTTIGRRRRTRMGPSAVESRDLGMDEAAWRLGGAERRSSAHREHALAASNGAESRRLATASRMQCAAAARC
jgi:hypothetical protein